MDGQVHAITQNEKAGMCIRNLPALVLLMAHSNGCAVVSRQRLDLASRNAMPRRHRV